MSRSFSDCSLISVATIAVPPASTVRPSRSPVTRSATAFAYFGALFSPPETPAITSAVVPSSLIKPSLRAEPSHGDTTPLICGAIAQVLDEFAAGFCRRRVEHAARASDHERHVHVALAELLGEHLHVPERIGNSGLGSRQRRGVRRHPRRIPPPRWSTARQQGALVWGLRQPRGPASQAHSGW